MTQPLLIEHDDGVDRVTLNRPESLNALNREMIDALNAYFEGLQRNRTTRVVVLKGAGQNFCAGLDLKQHLTRWLVDHGHEPVDHGAFVYDAVDDYPVFCLRAAAGVVADPGSLGVVIGG